MPYTITKTDRSPQPVLVMQRRVPQSGIAAAIGEALPRIFQFAQSHGIAIAGAPICRYLDMGPGLMTIEPGVPVMVSAPIPADAEIQLATLPGGTLAWTLHTGPYDRLGEAMAALGAWIEAQDLVSTGGPWESYITDPGAFPNPEDWKTEVFCPVGPRRAG